MGYLTHFSFFHIKGPEEQYQSLLQEIEDLVGDKQVTEDETFQGKWYSSDEDLKELSKKYPDLVFEVFGDGEDADDKWHQFWNNGEVMTEGLEFSIYKDIEEHFSPGLSIAKRSVSHILSELKWLIKDGHEMTDENGPVYAYVFDNEEQRHGNIIQMEVGHLDLSGETIRAYLKAPEGTDQYKKKGSLFGLYELNEETFGEMLIPTLCNIRKAFKRETKKS